MTMNAIAISEKTIDLIKETGLPTTADLADMLTYGEGLDSPLVFLYESEKQTEDVKVWAILNYQYLNDNYEVNSVGISEQFVTLSPKRQISTAVIVEEGDYLNTKFDLPVGYELTENDHLIMEGRA